jgi:hypothetical protein
MAQIFRTLVGAVWSDGGQRVARRNAWAAMSADAKRARERTEAMAFLDAVAAVHELPAPSATAARG